MRLRNAARNMTTCASLDLAAVCDSGAPDSGAAGVRFLTQATGSGRENSGAQQMRPVTSHNLTGRRCFTVRSRRLCEKAHTGSTRIWSTRITNRSQI